MQKILAILKSIINELLIVFILIILINNFIGNVDITIKADGIGYYDYLPSIFIHHDLNRHNLKEIKEPEKFNRINSLGVYVRNNSLPVNKYPCGVAILELPFFGTCSITNGETKTLDDGYQAPYQHFVFYAALFYLLLAIFFLKKILVLYNCNYTTIITAQLLLVLGTSVTDYVNFDASFSHIYSLFAITAFIFFVKKYFELKSFGMYFLACIFLGLIILIRPVNGMIVFIIPFLAGSVSKINEIFKYLLKHLPKTLLGLFTLLCIIAIQPFLWYLQTGQFFIYTYNGEKLNFLKPEVLNVLFSYKKGLFVYTPILLFCLTSLFWLLFKRKYYELVTSLLFLVVITFVISSWSTWDYGGCFGLRAFVDYYSIFFILFALMFDKMVLWVKVIFLIPVIFLVYLNLVQTYQYKEYILHWLSMDKAKYWTVFMKTEDRYTGLLWKWEIDANTVEQVNEQKLGIYSLPAHCDTVLTKFSTSQLRDIDKINTFQVGLTSDFKDENDAKIALTITDSSGKAVFYHDRYLLHFNSEGLNKRQAGLFNYILPQKFVNQQYNVKLEAYTNSNKLDISDVTISIFSDK